jgi:hypothetical protein
MSHALPNIPPTLIADFWLVVASMFKRRPPKAETPPLSLFFEGLRFGAPNEGTNNGDSATDAASLVWAHREQRRQDLGPWQMLSWRERAKAAEGWGRWLMLVVCVLWLCFVLWLAIEY